MKKYAAFLLVALAACNNPDYEVNPGKPEYFELKSYFEKEAARLQKANPTVKKTVVVGDKPETLTLKIASWTKELSSFIDADINKAAWKGEFQKKESKGAETYTSNNEKVPVKSVSVFKDQQQVSGIVIIIENKNYLYTSTDTLSYYPDKEYQVKKTQRIKLMKEKRYQITGLF